MEENKDEPMLPTRH